MRISEFSCLGGLSRTIPSAAFLLPVKIIANETITTHLLLVLILVNFK